MADFREDTVEVKPPIIMKVDAPPEDNNTLTSQGGSMNNLDQNDTNRTPVKPKKSVLGTPRLNSNNPFAMRSNVLGSPKLGSGVLLRPSALGSKLENKSENAKNPFSLNPSRLNPFAKVEIPAAAATEAVTTTEDTNNVSPEDKPTPATTSTSNDKDKSQATTVEANNGTSAAAETPKFVPLAVTETSTRGTTATVSATSTPNFVFGQNLHERVISESENAGEGNSSEPVASTSCTNANGTSELLFSSAAKNTVAADSTKEVKSLTESAREYEESRANKRKYEEVAIVTGEEDEKNVMQINCKLFAFDKATGNWQERGRGTLRLNDKEVTTTDSAATYTQSRLVIRTAGSLRVVLNTKIWAEMTVDKASLKSVRLTAMDGSGQIKVFLIMASTEEIHQLYRLLELRVRNEIERQKQLKNVSRESEPDAKKQAMDDNNSSSSQ